MFIIFQGCGQIEGIDLLIVQVDNHQRDWLASRGVVKRFDGAWKYDVGARVLARAPNLRRKEKVVNDGNNFSRHIANVARASRPLNHAQNARGTTTLARPSLLPHHLTRDDESARAAK